MLLKTLALIIIVSSSYLTLAQAPSSNPAKTDATEKLRKEAVVFLRETAVEVNGMRSLENRISFTAELANLMWFHDEREARAMFASVINDFRRLLQHHDAAMTTFAPGTDDEPFSGGILFGEMTDKGRISRRFAVALGVRKQIALSLSENDPELAYTFYCDATGSVANPELRKQMETRDAHFEGHLLARIAETEPARALPLAVKSVAAGFNYQHVELLKKLHTSDPEKSAELASAIVSRVRDEKFESSDYAIVSGLLDYGAESLDASRKTGVRKAVFTEAQLRELGDILGKAMSRDADELLIATVDISMIERFAPGRASLIKARSRSTYSYPVRSGVSSAADAANAASMAANAAAADAVLIPSTGTVISTSSIKSNSDAIETRIKTEQKLMQEVMSLGGKELPKEERERIIAKARKAAIQAPGREGKLMTLSTLATYVSSSGDKALAAEIMRDAQAVVSPAPKNFRDFMLTWMLASGLAQTDPDRAFAVLDNAINRANETIAAFIKVGEFFDVGEEMIQDGEVQIGGVGNGQMMRGITSELGMADTVISALANANFAKTRDLTYRFDRTETRVLSKMLVIRAVLASGR
ncbi:MAG: hypothetical protein LC730_03745, partial [Acidobacteria bacterium]|nr:hypothetical protein [Acidobacteriota bacterium]